MARKHKPASGLGHCSICRKRGRLVSDHCHQTDMNREVICSRCNSGLGMFMDDPEAMRRAADYVERHARRHAAIIANLSREQRLAPLVFAEYARCHPKARPQ